MPFPSPSPGYNVKILGGPHDGRIGWTCGGTPGAWIVEVDASYEQKLRRADEAAGRSVRYWHELSHLEIASVVGDVDGSAPVTPSAPVPICGHVLTSPRCPHGYPIERAVCSSRSCPGGYAGAPRT